MVLSLLASWARWVAQDLSVGWIGPWDPAPPLTAPPGFGSRGLALDPPTLPPQSTRIWSWGPGTAPSLLPVLHLMDTPPPPSAPPHQDWGHPFSSLHSGIGHWIQHAGLGALHGSRDLASGKYCHYSPTIKFPDPWGVQLAGWLGTVGQMWPTGWRWAPLL